MWCFFQTTDDRPPSEGDYSDVASVDTDEGSIGSADESDGRSIGDNDEDTDADDDEFVDAGDEVKYVADPAMWVTERRHSGDGEVRFYQYITILFLATSFCILADFITVKS